MTGLTCAQSQAQARAPFVDLDEWLDALAAWAEATSGGSRWTRFETELTACSAHDGSFRTSTVASAT
jgi:hypothetical protein